MAVRALANVWVRISYRLWKSGTCYQTAVFEQAQQQHARRAASLPLIVLRPCLLSKNTCCFLAFTLACPKQTTQAGSCQGKRSGLTASRGVVDSFMPR